MTAAIRRLEFAPPPPPGLGRAWGLALLAHLLLAAALTWGITWRHEDTALAAEAELWSAQVQQAAPPLQEAPPPPPPPPAVQATPTPPPPAPREADIALEREKKRIEQEKKKQDAEKAEAKKKADAEKKREAQEKAAKDKAAKDKAAKEQAQEQARIREEAQRAEALRQDQMRRIQGLAGATGAENATGNATRSSGPSDSYAGRIRARIKPNIVFTDNVTGNPVTEVEVRMAPDGTITSHRITKPSGTKAWDDAVLRALERTAVLPRDNDGRVHSPLILSFRPRD